MPMNFDSPDSFAHSTGDFLSGHIPNSAALIIELKLALIGNHDLKNRLIRDDGFPGWFSGHLHKCVDGLARLDVTGVENWRTPPPKSQEHAAFSPDSTGNSSTLALVPEGCTHEGSPTLADLENAIIVLRLLLSRDDTFERPFSPILPPTSSALDQCIPTLLALIKEAAEVALPQLSKEILSRKWFLIWESLSPILCDTICALLLFTESSKSQFSHTSSDILWKFLSNLLAQYGECGDSPILAPVVVEACNLVALLLELDAAEQSEKELKPMGHFLAQNLHCLDIQLGRIFGLQASTNDSDPIPASISNVKTVQNDIEFRVVSAMTVATAQILNASEVMDILAPKSAEFDFLVSNRFHQCLLTFFYADSQYSLNVAALNLVQFRVSNSPRTDTSAEDNTCSFFEKMFPRIVELLGHDARSARGIPGFLRPPITFLSDLCMKYPKFCTQLKNTGVDKRVMDDLARHLDRSTVFSFMQKAKNSYNKTKRVTDFSSLRRNPGFEHFSAENSQLSLIASHFLLLSVFTSSSEEFRRRITSYLKEKDNKNEPNFLCYAIFEVVENYDFLCSQLLLNYKILVKLQGQPQTESAVKLLDWLGENVSVLLALLEHPLNMNIFYLIRSLSRSVSMLRTFFVDCNSIRSAFRSYERPAPSRDPKSRNVIANIWARYDREANLDQKGNLIACLLKIMSRVGSVAQTVLFFASTRTGSAEAQRHTRKALCEKKVVILAIFANFILDFSSFRTEIVNHERFLKDLANLFKKSIHTVKQCEKQDGMKDAREIAYEQLKVQMGILQVVKNYLYNENEENRRVVWDYIPLSLIFEFSLYGISTSTESDSELHKLRLKQKIVAFEILRNLTAASPHFSEAIDKLYVDFVAQNVESTNCPKTWNRYLLENLLSFDLFLDIDTMPENSEKMFMENDEFLLRVLHEAEYVKLVVAINYLEDHRYTNIETFRVSDFPHKNLLRVWKRLLGIRLVRNSGPKVSGSDLTELVKLSNQINEVKVSITWILINLTWKDEDFGYDKAEGRTTDFHQMDIIVPTNDATSTTLTEESVVIDEEDEEEEGTQERRASFSSGRGSRRLAVNDMISSKSRAKTLYRYGFCSVLEKLITELSAPNYSSVEEKQLSIERFDTLNSNDLYEKCKTAQFQIISLISRSKSSAQRHQNHRDHGDVHPLRRLSNIASSRESLQIRRDVNRGGEGFGYWSDEDYAHDTPARVRSEDNREDTRDETRDETREEDNEMVEGEEFDEYWIS